MIYLITFITLTVILGFIGKRLLREDSFPKGQSKLFEVVALLYVVCFYVSVVYFILLII